MWWVPLFTATGLGLFVVLLHLWHQGRQRAGAMTYRQRFVQLVSQLETVTTHVNELSQMVRDVQDPKVLEYYESTLRILETLLAAVRRIAPFGSDPSMLDSAFFLVRDCRHRVGRTQQAFQDSVRGRKVKLEDLYGVAKAASGIPRGCYFCSRPLIASRLLQVKVKIDDAIREVATCKVCKEELETTKKVKVLYFMKDGQQVHWSEIPDYHPSEDFWNINEREAIRKTRKLELVVTNVKGKPEKVTPRDS